MPLERGDQGAIQVQRLGTCPVSISFAVCCWPSLTLVLLTISPEAAVEDLGVE